MLGNVIDKKVIYHEESKDIETRLASLVLGMIVVEGLRVFVLVKSVYYQGEMTKGFRVFQIAQVEFVR